MSGAGHVVCGDTSSVGRLDLWLLHGRESVSIHDIFPTTTACTKFLKDYACNQNKSIKQKSNGFLKKWMCKGVGCTWYVWITQKRPSIAKTQGDTGSAKTTKFGHVPVFAWYVSKLDLLHTQLCDAVAESTAVQISLMKGFQSSLVEGHSLARARVAAALRMVDNINMDLKPATLYRAINLFKSRVQVVDDYRSLPSLLAFQQKTPCSRSDGAHMKGEKYNGQCLTLIGLDGEGKNVPVAVAFVPSETNENFAWFFANCMVGGVNLGNLPVFTDRSKQRGAQKRLTSLGYQLNLKFCAFHITLNVKSHFRPVDPTIDRVEPFAMRLQKADTIAEYEAVLASIELSFPACRTRRRPDGQTEQQSVAKYLRSIHPTCWTNLGNYNLNEVESRYLQQHWRSDKAYGRPCRLIGVRTTSANEGENNALLWSGTRDAEVLMAFVTFCERASLTLAGKKKNVKGWTRDKSNTTPKGKFLYDKELARSSGCSVLPASQAVFYVEDCMRAQRMNAVTAAGSSMVPPKLARTHKVDLQNRTCMRCISS